eukprot:gnl/Dysnectes_brevis/6607_a10392_242.p1 GENE.gnl/Dysnectes_brevis/6607_a10392_242~~gnl/Dysnectes_brevis/6607_a10392_242.p1  ORF type:complete len:327 (+),score=60.81 gnl/Dysnectes_brevis/6607_a10392_242:47-1027(+)
MAETSLARLQCVLYKFETSNSSWSRVDPSPQTLHVLDVLSHNVSKVIHVIARLSTPPYPTHMNLVLSPSVKFQLASGTFAQISDSKQNQAWGIQFANESDGAQFKTALQSRPPPASLPRSPSPSALLIKQMMRDKAKGKGGPGSSPESSLSHDSLPPSPGSRPSSPVTLTTNPLKPKSTLPLAADLLPQLSPGGSSAGVRAPQLPRVSPGSPSSSLARTSSQHMSRRDPHEPETGNQPAPKAVTQAPAPRTQRAAAPAPPVDELEYPTQMTLPDGRLVKLKAVKVDAKVLARRSDLDAVKRDLLDMVKLELGGFKEALLQKIQNSK